MDQIEKEISQMIDEFVTNFIKTVKDFEKIHMKDRIQMRKNGAMALSDISPELATIFDKQNSLARAALREGRSGYAVEDSSSMGSSFISRSNSLNEVYYRQ